jgi:G:T/U-mismatch repair DNA glycosylase
MAAMLEVCPRGADKSILFPCLFLHRLPRELRVLLAMVDNTDLKALAEKVDELWALHTQEEMAAIQQLHLEEEAVAAVNNSGPHFQGGPLAEKEDQEAGGGGVGAVQGG